MTFIEAKQAYMEKRKEERDRISLALKNAGFENRKAAAGSERYGAALDGEPYDLRNWQYIEGVFDDIRVHISLQTFDRDSKTGNIHVLYDRIGLYYYRNELSDPCRVVIRGVDKTTVANDYVLMMKPTRFELPLTDEAIGELVDMIKEDIKTIKSARQADFENLAIGN